MEEDKTQFNAGIAKLKRLDALRQDIHNCRKSKNYQGWFDDLKGIRCEINEKFKALHVSEANKNEKNIQAIIRSRQVDLIESLLQQYDLFLGKLEHQFGYSMPDQDSARNALR